MAKFINFDNKLINTDTGNFFGMTGDFGISFAAVLGTTSYIELFQTEQERDARWQELEAMLLDKAEPVVNKITPKKTKTYYISIFKNEKHDLNDDKLTASHAHKSRERAENHSFKRLLKTIEVEL